MAGTDSAFDATKFRDGIKFAMHMGLPNATVDRATFKWDVERTFPQEDSGHNPYDWTETPSTTVTHEDVQVDVAVEFSHSVGDSDDLSVGSVNNPRATFTLLDVDYDQIEGAQRIELGENVYVIDFVAPPLGLFEVTVYQIYATSQDEA